MNASASCEGYLESDGFTSQELSVDEYISVIN